MKADASYVVGGASKFSFDPYSKQGPLAGIHGEDWEEVRLLTCGEPLVIPARVAPRLDVS